MPKASKKSGAKGNKKKTSSSGPSNARFVICPYTDQKIFVAKATLQDLKQKSTTSSSGKQKRLWTIASAQTRQEHYDKVAQAIAIVEQDLMPASGGRSWEVSVTLSEPNGRVLFRSYKGKMELAVLPHLLERIPDPPAWPGKRCGQAPDEYEHMQGEEAEAVAKKKHYYSEQDYIKGLTTREVSTLSTVAYEVLRGHPHNHPIPSLSIKWRSPDAKSFTSRKAAWEYAEVLAKQEVFINRNLFGVGASGKLLQVFYPSPKMALEMGKLRFVRDGLWVVGQELGWQEARPEEWQAQLEEQEEAKAEKVYTSGVQLYVATLRKEYKQQHADTCSTLAQADKELRQQWRRLSPQEQKEWNDKVQEQFESSSEEEESSDEEESGSDSESSSEEEIEYVSPLQFFIQKRRHDYRYERQQELNVDKFTLAQADKELRAKWREMSEEEQDKWIAENESGDEEEDDDDESEAEEEGEEDASSESEKESADEPKTGENKDAEREAGEKMDEGNDNAVAEAHSVSTAASMESKDVGTAASATPTKANLQTSTPVRSVSTNSHGEGSGDHNSQISEEQKGAGNDVVTSSQSKDVAAPVAPPSASAAAKTDSSDEDGDTASFHTAQSQPQKVESMEAMQQKPEPAIRSRAKQPPPRISQKYCMKPDQISLCHDACMDHFDTVMRTVKSRDLARELADGFDVLRERGRGRFDMELPAFDTPTFNFLNDFMKTPWMPVVRAILGEDVVLIHKGCFLSLPGAGAQVYHQDGVHLNKQSQQPCHAINVFVPLVDLQMKNGPTEFVLGSHVLGHDGYDRDFLETPTPTAGTPVIFDYRLGHRGLSNSSHSVRPIVYCTYARAADGKEFRDQVNFSRKRYHKIGDLSAKPLSREERRNKRKNFVESQEEAELRKALEISKAEGSTDGEQSDGAGGDDRAEDGNEAKKTKVSHESTEQENSNGENTAVPAPAALMEQPVSKVRDLYTVPISQIRNYNGKP